MISHAVSIGTEFNRRKWLRSMQNVHIEGIDLIVVSITVSKGEAEEWRGLRGPRAEPVENVSVGEPADGSQGDEAAMQSKVAEASVCGAQAIQCHSVEEVACGPLDRTHTAELHVAQLRQRGLRSEQVAERAHDRTLELNVCPEERFGEKYKLDSRAEPRHARHGIQKLRHNAFTNEAAAIVALALRGEESRTPPPVAVMTANPEQHLLCPCVRTTRTRIITPRLFS
eukprot:7249906-Prymnesium_polylepis.1